jgi:uncharacterized protein (TIGR02246 family)
MLKRSLVLVAMTAGLMTAPAFAQQAAQPGQQASQQERQAVENLNRTYVNAFNKQDVKGVGDLYANTGTIVGPSPNVLDGRQAIERQMTEEFQKGMALMNLATQVKEVRSLGNNLVVVIGTWEADPPQPKVAQGATTASPAQQAQTATQQAQTAMQQAQTALPQAQSGSSQAPARTQSAQGQRLHGMWTAVEEIHGNDAKLDMLTYNIITPQN